MNTKMLACRYASLFTLTALLASLGGCITQSVSGIGRSKENQGSSQGTGAGGGDPGCSVAPLATPAQIASTPRADREAELLALSRTNNLVAPTDVYERIARDLGAIRAAHPELGQTTSFPDSTDEEGLVAFLDDEGFAAAKAGTFEAWNCLNETYGSTSINYQELSSVQLNMAVVHFDGRFKPDLLAGEYKKLPHVQSASLDITTSLGGGQRSVCVGVQGTTYVYTFSASSGGCNEVCEQVQYDAFSTTAAGAITSVATYTQRNDVPGPPAPAWTHCL